MKTAIKTNIKSKTFYCRSYVNLKEKEIGFVDTKFYQKLFVVLITLSTILIFPESPKELANICERHNSRGICLVS